MNFTRATARACMQVGVTGYNWCFKILEIIIKLLTRRCQCVLSFITEFQVPLERSYHVFLLEDGTEFSLITQLFMEIQPNLILTSDTLMYLSNRIKRINEENCEQITARELSECIMGKVQDKIPSLNLSCLPLQVHSMFPALHKIYSQCENETEAYEYTKRVSSLNFNPPCFK